MRFLLFLLPAVWACHGGGTDPDGGLDSGNPVFFSVQGTVRIFPPAQAYLVSGGHAVPGLSGRQLTLEEPLRAALGDSLAVFGQSVTDTTAAFSFDGVPAANVDWLLGADVSEIDGGYPYAEVAPAATVLFDVGQEGQPPSASFDGGLVELLPVHYVDALETSIGTGVIGGVADAGGPAYLLETGYVLGIVEDDGGQPVTGARIVPAAPGGTTQVFYPDPSYTTTLDGGTSSTGVFVYVHTGGPPAAFTLSVAAHPEILPHNAVAAPGVGLVVKLAPGR